MAAREARQVVRRDPPPLPLQVAGCNETESDRERRHWPSGRVRAKTFPDTTIKIDKDSHITLEIQPRMREREKTPGVVGANVSAVGEMIKASLRVSRK